MIAELGHFALILALFTALAQSILTFAGLRANDASAFMMARGGALVQFALAAAAFLALLMLYAASDFSVLNVVQNSHTEKPFIYKLTGTWGNHEGSLVLWVLMLAGYSGALALGAQKLERRLVTMTLAVQSLVTAAFIGLTLFTSNPFLRVWPPAENGLGLNPLLQDPGLASHPPLLYAGYVGFSIVFSFAVAALILGRADAAWARIVRPWSLTAWIFLTVGIALGSNWAYYELGWGGWWAWDPVENASLLPWLAGTALIHSLRVMEKRDTLKSWTILLAISAFSLSLLGTFLVRSGVITSVHAFAVDPERGVVILGIVGLAIGAALTLYGWRASRLTPTGTFKPVSRESMLLINNVVFAAATALVLVGTFYELFVRVATDERLTVQAPFYNATFNPMMGALILLLPVSTLLAWKRGRLQPALRQLIPAMLAALGAAAIAVIALEGGGWAGAFGIGLGVWVMGGVLADIGQRIRLFDLPTKASLARLVRLPAGQAGMSLSHFGLGLLILGITGVSAYNIDRPVFMQEGETVSFSGYEITLSQVVQERVENYASLRADFNLISPSGDALRLDAEQRFYPVRGMQTTEAGIVSRPWGDIYLSFGGLDEARGWPVQLRAFPLAQWLWIGSALIALGGAIALGDRTRRRVAAPKKARAGAPEAAA